MTTATRSEFKITDSRDGHTKTFQPGVFFSGSNQEHCHIIFRNGKHKTVKIEEARKMWATIAECNKEKK